MRKEISGKRGARMALYEENVKTMDFFNMLVKRSKEAEENPQIPISLDDFKLY